MTQHQYSVKRKYNNKLYFSQYVIQIYFSLFLRNKNRCKIPSMFAPKWPHRFRFILPILVAAVFLRFYQLGWGLPYVFEEATPLKKAWSMWGWGTPSGPDLNPHFFNYPSLTIYLHFLIQGFMYLVMRIGGAVGSGADLQAFYITDPTVFYYAGRALSAAFGAGAVWLIYLVGVRLAGNRAGAAAAVFLAFNTFFISRAHLVEVDLPLVFFVLLALWLALRSMHQPSLKSYVIAGAAAGLAASTKYTGAMLLIPLTAAHLLSRRADRSRPPWRYFFLSLVVAAAVFALTSPYVILDAGAFGEDLMTERQHMTTGHFGLTASASWAYYARSAVQNLLGWPAVLAALVGLAHLAAIRRRPEALVLSSFFFPYLLTVSLWSMHAERYLMPVLPLLMLFAAAAFALVLDAAPLARRPWSVRVFAAAALGAALVLPAFVGYPAYLKSIGADTRAAAARWMERNLPSGSYLVVEPYGPQVFGPRELSQVTTKVRSQVLKKKKGTPNYAFLEVPMFQVTPERSGVFYDLPLYENADYFITTGAVRSRYLREPALFRRQVLFYDSLEVAYEKIAEFTPGYGGGSVITVYHNRSHSMPFGARGTVAPPRALRHLGTPPTGSEELFYFSVGLNYEVFMHLPEALASYDLALGYPIQRVAALRNLAARKTHCLVMMGRKREAAEFLETMITRAPDSLTGEQLRRLRETVLQMESQR